MKKLTIVIIPDQAKQVKQFTLPLFSIKIFYLSTIILLMFCGYFILDYSQLRIIRNQHHRLISENQHLKGEAQILMNHLEEVKHSLRRVQDYTNKLSELVNFRVKSVSKKTGLGAIAEDDFIPQVNQQFPAPPNSTAMVPLGINIDKLILRPAFEGLATIGYKSNKQAIELQQLLSTLSQKKSLLAGIPSISPVDGWVTSNFGVRLSPFTGKKSFHKGVDIAAPEGTPIISPADGVVIFSGAKVGFGNFIMIAHHGSGIVSAFGHNAQNMVQAGQQVSRGEQISSVGMTGKTTGPHLHYEVWVNGQAVNPRKFILDNTNDILLSN